MRGRGWVRRENDLPPSNRRRPARPDARRRRRPVRVLMQVAAFDSQLTGRAVVSGWPSWKEARAAWNLLADSAGRHCLRRDRRRHRRRDRVRTGQRAPAAPQGTGHGARPGTADGALLLRTERIARNGRRPAAPDRPRRGGRDRPRGAKGTDLSVAQAVEAEREDLAGDGDLGDWGSLPPEQRNAARYLFLDDGAGELYPDWGARSTGGGCLPALRGRSLPGRLRIRSARRRAVGEERRLSPLVAPARCTSGKPRQETPTAPNRGTDHALLRGADPRRRPRPSPDHLHRRRIRVGDRAAAAQLDGRACAPRRAPAGHRADL
jgi:hypothetical protein